MVVLHRRLVIFSLAVGVVWSLVAITSHAAFADEGEGFEPPYTSQCSYGIRHRRDCHFRQPSVSP